MARVHFVVSILAALAGLGSAVGQTPRTDTPSGLPVPRFAVLKYDSTACRTGPSFSHPVAVTYLRAGLPVEITAETHDHWRRIRDVEGGQCWAHKTTLRSAPRAIAVDRVAIRRDPADDANVRAYLEPGVIVVVKKQRDGWALVEAGAARGWTQRVGLWGVSD
jgi:SH3-like domain-containing protein